MTCCLYWYWRGVGEALAGAPLETVRRAAVLADAEVCDVDLQPGLEPAMHKVDRIAPAAMRLRWGRLAIATVPAEPGAEPLQGRHLRGLLRTAYARRFADTLQLAAAVERPATSESAHGLVHEALEGAAGLTAVMLARSRDWLISGAWLAWASVLLSHYYVQVARTLRDGHLPSRSVVASAGAVALLLAGSALWIRFFSIPQAHAARLSRCLHSRAASLFLIAGLLTVPWLLSWHHLAASVVSLSAPGFPALGEAVGRAAAALTGAVLVAAAALGSGSLVLRLIGWRTSSSAEQVVFGAATGVGVVSYGSLVLAAAGVYRPLGGAILIAILLAASAAHARRPIGEWSGRAAPDEREPVTALWFGVILVALGYALIAALAPEKEYDALWYHLQLPRVWMEAGRPVDIVDEYVSLYPLTWELVFGAGMALGGPIAAKLLHFACLPLLALLVAQAARRFVPGASPVAAAAFVVTTPTLLWQSTTAYVDLALALHTAAACYALAHYAASREWSWGGLAALQFGLAAATKHLGILVTVIALGLFVVAAHNRRGVRRAIKPALLIALVAAAVPAPWYLRAWLRSGNPVFPELFGVFGALPPERWDAVTDHALAHFKAHFGMGRSPVALLLLPWNVTVHGALFSGSLGPIFLLLAPLVLFVRQPATAVRWLTAGIAAYVLLWASPVSSFQLRFLLPIVAPMALLAATALNVAREVESKVLPRASGLVTAVVMCLALLNLPPFTPLHEADRVGWNGWLTHVLRESPVTVVAGRESQATYLRREVRSFRAWEWINTRLPADARVLAFSGGDQLYAARSRISHDATSARAAVWGGSDKRVGTTLAALRALGITHILFDRRELARLQPEALAVASPEFMQACVAEYDDGQYWVCGVDYSPERERSGQSP